MIHRAHNLSSSNELFNKELDNIRSIFLKLKYPDHLIDTTITNFVKSLDVDHEPPTETSSNSTVRLVLPYIDQKPADIVRRQISQLNRKLDTDLQPVFVSRKLCDLLKPRENKPPIVNQQLVVYEFKCGSCDASYVGYTSRHLHQRIDEHKYSAIGKHRYSDHGQTSPVPPDCFHILKKCVSKFDCLIYEMLFIKSKSPALNVQSDSVKAKLFV
jgi:hypothetical protein